MPGCAGSPSRRLLLAGFLCDLVRGLRSIVRVAVEPFLRLIVSRLSNQSRFLQFNDQPLRFAASVALVIACVVSLALRQIEARYEFDLLPNGLAHQDGMAFRAAVRGQVSWPWQRTPDTISNIRQSRLSLFEDDRPLGPPHQDHAEIRTLGKGRYSDWDNYILFSSSDNSDPRTNGRRYHAIDYAKLSPLPGLLPWLLLSTWLIANASSVKAYANRSSLVRTSFSAYLALQQRVGSLGIFLIIATFAAIIANLVIVRHWPMPAIMTSDTPLYLSLNEVRTIGYPLFLKGIMLIFNDLKLLATIQLNLLICSVIILGWAVARVLDNLLCGLALVLVLIFDPSLFIWAEQLMTEGLFIALLLAHAATVLLLLTQPRRLTAAFAGLTLVAVILVRPAAYSLLLNLLLLIVLLRGRQITILVWTIIPAAALYVAAAGAHKIVLGTWQSQSLAGFTLIGKAAFLIHGDVSGAPPVGEEIYRQIEPQVKDAAIKSFPSELWIYVANWYDPLLFEKIQPVLFAYTNHVDANAPDTYGAAWQQMNAAAWSLAVRIIENDPIGYIRLVLAQYYGLWSITLRGVGLPPGDYYTEMVDSNLRQLQQDAEFKSRAEQLGLDAENFRATREEYRKNWSIYRRIDEILQTAVHDFRFGLVSTAAFVVFLFCPYWLWKVLTGREISRASAALLYLGVAVNGYYILVATVEFALPRYVEAFEGIVLAIDVIALSAAITCFLSAISVSRRF